MSEVGTDWRGCPQCSFDNDVLVKYCAIHEKIADLQSDLEMMDQINRSNNRVLGEIAEIISSGDDDNIVTVARYRMNEIKALEESYEAIKGALGTDEDDEALVEVARNAHRAEQKLAAHVFAEREP